MVRTYTILACGGFLVGVAVGSWWAVPNWGVAVYLGCGLLATSLLLHHWDRRIWLIAWFLILAVAGNWRLGAASIVPNSDISRYVDQVVTLQGIIVDDPQVSAEATKFALRVRSVDDRTNVSGKVLVQARRYPTYQYGNLLSLTGKLSAPADTAEDSYAKYLARFDIYTRCDYPDIQVVSDFVGNPIWRMLYQIKHYFLQAINQVMSEPTAGLLAGLLLGVSAALPKNLLDSFNATGLTHIIALSGFNISIVSGAVVNLLRWLPLQIRLSTAIILIWLFVLLTGAAPSAVRAAIMGMFILLAGLFGRLADITVSMCLTATAMVAMNPKILLGDVGFQLSFLATVGIIYLSPLLLSWLRHWPRPISGLLSVTLSALIFVTPILMINFGRISLVAPLTNLLVVPLVPLAMLLGFWAVVGGMIQTDLGLVLGWIAWAPLRLVVLAAEYFRQFPWASINITVAPGLWMISYYLAIIILLMIYYARKIPTPLWDLSRPDSR